MTILLDETLFTSSMCYLKNQRVLEEELEKYESLIKNAKELAIINSQT